MKIDVYKNRSLEEAGYDELVEKLQEIEEDANRVMERREINGFLYSV
jgi:hypothetical protein